MTRTTTTLAQVRTSADVSLGYSGRARATSRQPVPTQRLAWLDGIEPAGAIWSNADDMTRWLRMLVGGGVHDGRRILSDSGMRQILSPAVRTGSSHYGLGWFIENWHGVTLYTHAGGVNGFGARCEFAPALGLGWAVLTNVDDGELPGAVRELIYQRLGRPATITSTSPGRP
jgi:CubicO group peptidase (beta-lactamase class C family)